MEILGDIHDISIQRGKQAKIKIRTVTGSDIIIDKIELIVDKKGKITKQ
jgi:hypothetical protein